MNTNIILGMYNEDGLAKKLFRHFRCFPLDTIKVDGISASYSEDAGTGNLPVIIILQQTKEGKVTASGKLYETGSVIDGDLSKWKTLIETLETYVTRELKVGFNTVNDLLEKVNHSISNEIKGIVDSIEANGDLPATAKLTPEEFQNHVVISAKDSKPVPLADLGNIKSVISNPQPLAYSSGIGRGLTDEAKQKLFIEQNPHLLNK